MCTKCPGTVLFQKRESDYMPGEAGLRVLCDLRHLEHMPALGLLVAPKPKPPISAHRFSEEEKHGEGRVPDTPQQAFGNLLRLNLGGSVTTVLERQTTVKASPG